MKVKFDIDIGIHCPQQSPQAEFWVMSCSSFVLAYPHFFHTNIFCVFGSLPTYCNNLAFPMSLYECMKWWVKIEIGIHHDLYKLTFQSQVGGCLDLTHFRPHNCVCRDLCYHITAAWLFQEVIMSIINVSTRLWNSLSSMVSTSWQVWQMIIDR